MCPGGHSHGQPAGGAWTRQYADFARGVALDADGTATVVGSTTNALGAGPSAGGYDGYIRRYDAAGTHLWTSQLGSPGNDFAVAVTTDAFVSQFGVGGESLWTDQFGTH